MTEERLDDFEQVRKFTGAFQGKRALVVLGGPSASGWEDVAREVNPDVLIGANGVNCYNIQMPATAKSGQMTTALGGAMMKEIVSGIYEIRNTVNGKRYIGSAVNIFRRWEKHKSDLNRNKHHSRHLQNAWNKYGADCFVFSIIEICFSFALIVREQYFIDKLRPEYNVSPKAYSVLGIKRTDETRAKMSLSAMGNKKTLGYKHTPEARAKISAAKIGNKRSKECQEKLNAKLRISMLGNQHLLGHKHSPETRAKMSAAHRNISDETRQKMSDSRTGKRHSEEAKEKVRIAKLLWWANKKAKESRNDEQ